MNCAQRKALYKFPGNGTEIQTNFGLTVFIFPSKIAFPKEAETILFAIEKEFDLYLALLAENPNPNREEIIKHMNGVLCRCGTYLRILKAIEKTAQKV